jgi:hypothetical protein
VLEEPEVLMGLQLYWVAFHELSTCRTIGMGAGPIPWTAIADYCDAWEIYGEQRETLFHLVKAMDAAYGEYQAKKKK